jgi:hypothetical protein
MLMASQKAGKRLRLLDALNHVAKMEPSAQPNEQFLSVCLMRQS